MTIYRYLTTFAVIAATAGVTFSAPKPPTADELARIERAAPATARVTPKRARKLLIVSGCEGFTHSSIPHGAKAFEITGRKTGAFTTTVVQDLSILEKPEFDTFDAIVMNNCTVRLPLLNISTAGMNAAEKKAAEARETKAQKRFLDFVRNGKGLVGIHAATDALYKWPEYGELIGGYFSGHPWNESVRVKLDDPGHPLLQAFNGQGFDVADEIYQFRTHYSRDTLHVLLSLDVKHTNMDKKGIKREDKDFGVAWIRKYGKGRVFYFSLGHRHEIFWNEPIMRCYLDGIQYALGDLEADATPSARLSKEYLSRSEAKALSAGLVNVLKGLETYEFGQGDTAPRQIEALVAKHQGGDKAVRNELSAGLAGIAANTRATLAGRGFACRQLALIGTDNAVPALAPLLTDDTMGDWARYAIGRIPGKAADEALVVALDRASGAHRPALAAVLGERRVAPAVAALGKLLSTDVPTAIAAAEALGRIAGTAATDVLLAAQTGANGRIRTAVDRALLTCGETAGATGDSATGMKIYARLFSADTAAHVRATARYGAAMLRGADGIADALAALRQDDTETARAGARLVADLPGDKVVPAIAAELGSLPASSQMLAIDALAARADRSARDAALSLAASENVDVRIAALRALEVLGDGKAVATAIHAAASAADSRERDAARRTLNRMNGPGVDEAIAEAMKKATGGQKIEYVKVLGARKARPALPALLDAACADDAALAKEARKSIGLLVAAEDLPDVVSLLTASQGSSTLRQLENIIVATAKRAEGDAIKTSAVLAGLRRDVPTDTRCALLSALGGIAAPSGLPALTKALDHADAAVRRTAVKALAERWPDAAPIAALRKTSQRDADEGNRILALRGYARMLAMPSKRPTKETLALYGEALDMAAGAQEKRALISGLGHLAHPDAFAFVKPYLDDKSVQSEALVAAIAISEGLAGGNMVLTGSAGKGTERNAIDGSDKTRWTTGAHMVGGEWFMVDLGYETDIKEVFLDAGPTGHDQPRGYEIHVSLDGKEWGKPVVKGGDPGKRAFTIALPPTYGRFVKIVQTGQHGLYWSINELKINGLPDQAGGEALDRAGWKVSASSAPTGEGPEHAIDGDLEKRWGTGSAMQPGDWFRVDLGEVRTVRKIVMNAARSANDYPRGYRIHTSMNGKEWFGPIGAGKGDNRITTAVVLPTKARFVKIEQTGSHDRNWWSMYDLKVFGQ